MDFPITRHILISVEEWFIPIVQPFLPLKKVQIEGGFHWDFEEHSARTVILGKALRIISGVRAAMVLADLGYVPECAAILRTIDDALMEIGFLLDGCRSKEPSEDHAEFVRQYFLRMPESSDEYALQPKVRWVSREKILSGFVRTMQAYEKDTNKVRKAMRFIYYAYDKYVHGGYTTTMELYSGERQGFMLHGHDDTSARAFYKSLVAGRLFQAMGFFVKVAELVGNGSAANNIRTGGIWLADSGELP